MSWETSCDRQFIIFLKVTVFEKETSLFSFSLGKTQSICTDQIVLTSFKKKEHKRKMCLIWIHYNEVNIV